MNTITPDWSTLPEDLLSFTAKRLHSLGDTFRFRAICRSFRSSIPPPKLLFPPSELRIPFPCDSHPHTGGHFILTHSTVYTIKPLTNIPQTYQTWLTRVQKFNSGEVRVQNPVFATRFQAYFTQNLPKSFNLLDYHVKEIDKAYHLELVSPSEGKPVLNYFKKVVVSTCDDDFSIMTLYAVRTVIVWRNVEENWTFVSIPCGQIADIIYHNKKFYVLASTGLIVSVDPKSLAVNEVAGPVRHEYLNPVYLLKASEDLFMICSYKGSDTFRLNEFYIFKVNEAKHECVRVTEELKNRMLFLNEDHSFSVSADEFSGCEGNTVYYTCCNFNRCIDNRPGLSVGIFHLKDGYNVPNYSTTFLPPPLWLK